MPVYNAKDYVEQAIRSIWDQTHPVKELIVVDDGSTDGSHDIVAALTRQSPIPMQFWRQDNAGPAAALSSALERATGEWLCWLAADDFYAPNFVERNLEVAAELARPDLVLHSNAYLVEASGAVTGVIDDIAIKKPFEGHCFDQIAEDEGRMFPSSMFTRRQLLLDAGGFDATLRVEDTDLFLRMGRVGFFHYIREPIFNSRYSPGSYGKRPWMWGETIIKAYSKHADVLGEKLQRILRQHSEELANNCFEYGSFGQGFYWSKRAVGYASGSDQKIRVAGKLSLRFPRAVARYIAHAVVGRERLVQLKRKLQGY